MYTHEVVTACAVGMPGALSAGSSDLRKIMPIREIVAGEAEERSCDSNRKLTLGPNWILSPDGMVNSLKGM